MTSPKLFALTVKNLPGMTEEALLRLLTLARHMGLTDYERAVLEELGRRGRRLA